MRTFLWHSAEQQSGALGFQVTCAAGFEDVKEYPHLHKTSTALGKATEKFSSSPTAMRAVEKHSPPEQLLS